MKCVISGGNVKILAKAVHALAKIGEEMYIEPRQSNISFRTINMANSAYADFTYFQSYFSYYEYGDLQENDALKCKISMRSAMTVFKAVNLIEKQVETCHIKLEPDASEILFILKCKNSITKTYLLPILDCEILQTQYDKDCALVKLSSQPRVLGDALQNFQQNLIEITLEVSAQKLLLRNYVDTTSGLSNTTRTQLALGRGEFDRYDIGSETSITFCMKEFKSILNFAETSGTPMSIYFEGAGRPVIFTLKNPSFEVNLVMSTLSADTDSQTDTTLCAKQEQSTTKKTRKKRVSQRATNTSLSRMQSRSNSYNKTLGNTVQNNVFKSFVEGGIQKEHQTSKENANLSINRSSRSGNNDKTEKKVSPLPASENVLERSERCPVSFNENNQKLNKAPSSGKDLVSSVFSTITKRKSSSTENKWQMENNESITFDEPVPNSPPPPTKKARLIFKKCFQTTFDPTTLPGYDTILAEDSDECCSN